MLRLDPRWVNNTQTCEHMKAEQLKQALRAIIKEEVKKAVSEEVSRAMGKVLVEMVKEIKGTSIINEQAENVGTTHTPIINTKNPKLNSVLAATAKNYTPMKRTEDSHLSMADLLEEGFDKIGQGEDIGITQPVVNDGTKIGFLKSIVTESAGTPSVLDRGAEVPDILKKVFKKDFRQVMKAIDEKKKFGGSGMINMNQVLSG